MPAPASSLGNDSDEGVPTVQMPQFDRMDSFDWDSPAASQQAPQPQQAPQTPAVPVAPQMQVPQQPMSAAPAQPFPPVDQGAAAQQVHGTPGSRAIRRLPGELDLAVLVERRDPSGAASAEEAPLALVEAPQAEG